MSDATIYLPDGLSGLELNLPSRVLFEKNTEGNVIRRIRLTPMEFAVLYALLRSYEAPGYITANDVERATETSFDHVRQVIVHNLNVKLQPLGLEVVVVSENRLAVLPVKKEPD